MSEVQGEEAPLLGGERRAQSPCASPPESPCISLQERTPLTVDSSTTMEDTDTACRDSGCQSDMCDIQEIEDASGGHRTSSGELLVASSFAGGAHLVQKQNLTSSEVHVSHRTSNNLMTSSSVDGDTLRNTKNEHSSYSNNCKNSSNSISINEGSSSSRDNITNITSTVNSSLCGSTEACVTSEQNSIIDNRICTSARRNSSNAVATISPESNNSSSIKHTSDDNIVIEGCFSLEESNDAAKACEMSKADAVGSGGGQEAASKVTFRIEGGEEDEVSDNR